MPVPAIGGSSTEAVGHYAPVLHAVPPLRLRQPHRDARGSGAPRLSLAEYGESATQIDSGLAWGRNREAVPPSVTRSPVLSASAPVLPTLERPLSPRLCGGAVRETRPQ